MPANAGFGLTVFHQGAAMVRFLHTSDWQLGMRWHFLDEGAQERYTQARVDAARAMGRITEAEGCRFMMVCGDAFASNWVDRRTLARALEALCDVPVPVYLLPGNHDPLNEASEWELLAWVFSFRERARLIRPDWLVARFHETLAAIRDNYKN